MIIQPMAYLAMPVFTTAELTPDALGASTLMLPVGTGGDWDLAFREIGNIIYDPTDTGKEFKLLYSGYSGAYAGNNVYVGGAYSSDGFSWTKYSSVSPLIARSLEDPYVIKVGSTYYLYAEDKADSPFRNIRCYTSTDFATWTDQGDVLDKGTGWEATDVSSPIVWKDGSTWHMLYEGRGTNQEGAVGHATSSDGLTWSKDGSNPVFVGTNATYSYTGVDWASAVVPDELTIAEDGTYVLTFHGDHTDSGGFVPGIATGASITTLADVLGQPFLAPSEENAVGDGTVMLHPALDPPQWFFVRTSQGIYRAAETTPPVTVVDATFTGSNGSTTFTENGEYQRTMLAFGNAQIQSNKLELDGTGDYVSVTSEWYRIPNHRLEIEAFGVVFDSVTGTRPIASVYDLDSNRRCWTFAVSGGNLFFRLSANGSTTTTAITAGAPIATATSYDLKAVWDGTNAKAYINGVEVATIAFAGPIAVKNPSLKIGVESVVGGAAYMDGRMTRLKVSVT